MIDSLEERIYILELYWHSNDCARAVARVFCEMLRSPMKILLQVWFATD